MSVMGPGVVLAERFRLDAPARGSVGYAGVDLESGAAIHAFEVPRGWVKPVRPGVGVTYGYLATLLGDVVVEHTHILVTEHVPGVTLEQELGARHRWTPVESVKCALRLAESVETLHEAGATHGFVHPASVIIEPEHRSGPVLGWALAVSASGHRCPERGEEGPPTFEDDSWAVASVLYEMLTGQRPPDEGFASPDAVRTAGVEDEELCGTIAHALASDASARANLHELKRELARWFVNHAGEGHDEQDEGTHSMPPPLPEGMSSHPPGAAVPGMTSSVPTAQEQPRSKKPVIALALGAIVVGLGAAWGVSAWMSKPDVQIVETSPSASAAQSKAPASAKAVSLGDVPVTAESEPSTGDKMASCVGAHLPKGAFKKSPDLSWMCAQTDPREGAGKLRTAVVEGAGTGNVTDAMRIFSKLGWYEMAAYAVVRAGCCPPDSKPIELPEPADGCDAMAPALTNLSKAVTSAQGYDAALEHIAKVFDCEAGKNRASLFRHTTGPKPHEQAAFRELVTDLASQ